MTLVVTPLIYPDPQPAQQHLSSLGSHPMLGTAGFAHPLGSYVNLQGGVGTQ